MKPTVCDTKLHWCFHCHRYEIHETWTEAEHRHEYQIFACETCGHLDLERIAKRKRAED